MERLRLGKALRAWLAMVRSVRASPFKLIGALALEMLLWLLLTLSAAFFARFASTAFVRSMEFIRAESAFVAQQIAGGSSLLIIMMEHLPQEFHQILVGFVLFTLLVTFIVVLVQTPLLLLIHRFGTRTHGAKETKHLLLRFAIVNALSSVFIALFFAGTFLLMLHWGSFTVIWEYVQTGVTLLLLAAQWYVLSLPFGKRWHWEWAMLWYVLFALLAILVLDSLALVLQYWSVWYLILPLYLCTVVLFRRFLVQLLRDE